MPVEKDDLFSKEDPYELIRTAKQIVSKLHDNLIHSGEVDQELWDLMCETAMRGCDAWSKRAVSFRSLLPLPSSLHGEFAYAISLEHFFKEIVERIQAAKSTDHCSDIIRCLASEGILTEL